MKILITGANGFIGKNLKVELENRGYKDLLLCDVDTSSAELRTQTKQCEFVFHLAGVNRPEKQEDFMEGNYGFTTQIIELLKENRSKAPILMTSSIQALLGNPYGASKLAGEEYILEYSKDEDIPVYIFRLSNVFGKWSRPNYNSVVATFCYNIANGLPVQINDGNVNLNLIYIDDVVNTLISAMEGKEIP
ncbi:MAG TPA: NAD-dependent epimerase/dehydratase family protein, partial [Anaerovoracaceae bacterium]|nr:NAD-dependent epimerase/dehydratase family protein [Anaerovoracaceae bacterium]